MVISPAGLGTKNDCAGEAQQQFTRQSEPVDSQSESAVSGRELHC
jgi:hypothetical protein